MLLKLFGAIFIFASLPIVPNARAKPERIVSLAPVITEILFTLNVEDKLVGVTRFCDRPAAAQKIKKVGGFIDPQLEVIRSLKPDLVIGMPIPGHQKLFDQLKKHQIEILIIKNDSIADIENSILKIGVLLKKEESAFLMLTQIKKELEFYQNALSCLKNERILIALATQPFVVAGPNTFPNEIIKLLGAYSAVPQSALSWPIWSMESLLGQAPKVILATGGTAMFEQLKKQLAPFLKHEALSKTILINPVSPILQRPGPYLIDDVSKLAYLLIENGICHFKAN